MTGKLVDKVPLTMSSLINTIPDSLYPEEDIPTSMNIFTNTDSISHYSQMNTDNIMDLGMGGDKNSGEIQYGSSSFQSSRSGQTVTYLGKFAFDTPPSGGISSSGWCPDNNIISLVSAGILGVSPSPGNITTQTTTSGGSMGGQSSDIEQVYAPPLPAYSTCGEMYQDQVSFHHSPATSSALPYAASDYHASSKPGVDSGLFSMIPDYNLFHHQGEVGVMEHKPFQTMDPIRVNPPPITPLETIRAFKDKQQIHPSFLGGQQHVSQHHQAPQTLALKPIRPRKYPNRPSKTPVCSVQILLGWSVDVHVHGAAGHGHPQGCHLLVMVLFQVHEFLLEFFDAHLQFRARHRQLVQYPSQTGNVRLNGLAHRQLVLVLDFEVFCSQFSIVDVKDDPGVLKGGNLDLSAQVGDGSEIRAVISADQGLLLGPFPDLVLQVGICFFQCAHLVQVCGQPIVEILHGGLLIHVEPTIKPFTQVKTLPHHSRVRHANATSAGSSIDAW